MNYFMQDSAADLKQRLLGKEPERRFHWITYGLVAVLTVAVVTVPIWAKAF